MKSYKILKDVLTKVIKIFDNKIRLDNMYTAYNIRPELLKSRQFYNNALDTSVNYDGLMVLKKELMKYLIIFEGLNELEFIRMLLEHDKNFRRENT